MEGKTQAHKVADSLGLTLLDVLRQPLQALKEAFSSCCTTESGVSILSSS